MTQELPTGLRRGAIVRARGDRWRVLEAASFADCTQVDLAGAGRHNAGVRRTLIAPFDRLEVVNIPSPSRLVRRTAWMRAFRTLACHTMSAVHLRTAASARADLLPYQLEPALALIRGISSRFLLADEVGLGKTVQAALMLAELRARGQADRTLVLAPAGLRDQWATELLDRFGISSDIVDRHSLRDRVASLPRGMNPWTMAAVSIASLDFVKQPEVLRPLLGVLWDVLVVDEAHDAATAPERHAAIRALAERAWHVVLITATPHSGDPAAFDALCRTGRSGVDGPVAMFRRSRSAAGFLLARRVKVLLVRPTEAEQRMHACLRSYAACVWREATERADSHARLAMTVLCKRGLSSASSLLLSVERRLALLGRTPIEWSQEALPFAAPSAPDDGEHDDDDDDPIDALAIPGLEDRQRECDWLAALKQTAIEASLSESKMRAVVRMLARISEPALVFTEFRDTLTCLAQALRPMDGVESLHGGLNRAERQDACRRFCIGDTRILLATDVAGQGLNLQTRCRLVISLELPWNPMRLEQRIGRVDRIGQRRIVHACHLVAGGTAEDRVLVRLATRLARVRDSIGELRSPLGMTEARIAHAMIDPECDAISDVRSPWLQSRTSDFVATRLTMPAIDEASRAADLRRLLEGSRGATSHHLEPDRPLIAVSRRRRVPLSSSELVVVYRVLTNDGSGRLIDERLVPARCESSRLAETAAPAAIRDWLRSHWTEHDARLRAAVRAHLDAADDPTPDILARLKRLHDRGQFLANGLDRAARTLPVQIGLFDRRAIQRLNQTASEIEDERGELTRRLLAATEALSVPWSTQISLALILLPSIDRRCP